MVEKVLQLHKEKTIFWILASILALLLVLYIYFIRVTISNVVVRQNLESESSSLSVMIGTKEFEYITKRNAVTLAVAHSMGFKNSQDKTFITRITSTKIAYLSN